MSQADPNFSKALGQVTTFLLSRKVLKNDEVFQKALNSMSKHSKSPVPPSSSPPRLMALKRLVTERSKIKSPIENSKEKIIKTEEKLSKFKPKINEYSKNLVKITQNQRIRTPILERVRQDLIQRKEREKRNEFLKSQKEDQDFIKNCSFSPVVQGKTTRTPEKVVQDLLRWKKRKEIELNIKQEWFQQQRRKEFYDRPEINKRSKGISKSRLLTPVVERLMATQPTGLNKSFIKFFRDMDSEPAETSRRLSALSSTIESINPQSECRITKIP